jgi:guanylate kinase
MSIVFTISGTSGSGRSSIAHLACKLLDGLDLAISYATRPHMVDKRDSDFFFTSRETFELMIERDEFLEYVSSFGNYYGTPTHYLQQAREKGKDLLIQVDDSGVVQIRQKIPDVISILVQPGQSAQPAGSDSDEVLFYRLRKASSPSQMPSPDMYDHIVANDQLEETVNKIIEIIRTERSRRS